MHLEEITEPQKKKKLKVWSIVKLLMHNLLLKSYYLPT